MKKYCKSNTFVVSFFLPSSFFLSFSLSLSLCLPPELQERAELLEIFCTEFQMRLLWGSRGSEGSQAERYEKFDKVLTALSHKLETPVRHSEL